METTVRVTMESSNAEYAVTPEEVPACAVPVFNKIRVVSLPTVKSASLAPVVDDPPETAEVGCEVFRAVTLDSYRTSTSVHIFVSCKAIGTNDRIVASVASISSLV